MMRQLQLSLFPSAAAGAAPVPPRDVFPPVSHPCLSVNAFCQQNTEITPRLHACARDNSLTSLL